MIGHIAILDRWHEIPRLTFVGDEGGAVELQCPLPIYEAMQGVSKHKDDWFLCEYTSETIRTEYTTYAGTVTKLEPYVWPKRVWVPAPEVKHECTIFSPPSMQDSWERDYAPSTHWSEMHNK